MKKVIPILVLCVIFIIGNLNFNYVFAFHNEHLEFIFSNSVFVYNLSDNIKTSSIFDKNYTINKYDRFSSREKREELLKKMLTSGIEESVAVEYLFPNIKNKIKKIEKLVNVKAVDAKLEINPNSEKVFNISKEQVGRKVDKTSLYSNICKHYLSHKPLKFIVPTYSIEPTTLSKDFKKFSFKRSDFSTDISSSTADRKHNIKNALNAINKAEIYPNEVFSFNRILGKRTIENGYRTAKIIVGDEFVDGIGGGVCQVSSTLYNSALLAGLEIVEANKHSKQVGYVKYGFDAMVNFGSSDLKFKNNLSEKITIITNYSTNKIRIRIYGEEMKNTSYKLTNEIVSVTEPKEEIKLDETFEYADKVQYDDEFFYLKKASKGMEIKSYREKYVNGQLESKQLLRFDKFKVQNAIKIYGTKKRPENLSVNVIPFDSLDKYNQHN